LIDAVGIALGVYEGVFVTVGCGV
jgi:hypothetical protein